MFLTPVGLEYIAVTFSRTMFSPDEQRRIHAKAIHQWQVKQRDLVTPYIGSWPFPLTDDDYVFLFAVLWNDWALAKIQPPEPEQADTA